MLPLTEKELNLHQDSTLHLRVTFTEKNSNKSLLKIKIIIKLETTAILLLNIQVQHKVYAI